MEGEGCWNGEGKGGLEAQQRDGNWNVVGTRSRIWREGRGLAGRDWRSDGGGAGRVVCSSLVMRPQRVASVAKQQLCRRLHIPRFWRQGHYYCILGRERGEGSYCSFTRAHTHTHAHTLHHSWAVLSTRLPKQKPPHPPSETSHIRGVHACAEWRRHSLCRSPWHTVCLFCGCIRDWRRAPRRTRAPTVEPSVWTFLGSACTGVERQETGWANASVRTTRKKDFKYVGRNSKTVHIRTVLKYGHAMQLFRVQMWSWSQDYRRNGKGPKARVYAHTHTNGHTPFRKWSFESRVFTWRVTLKTDTSRFSHLIGHDGVLRVVGLRRGQQSL